MYELNLIGTRDTYEIKDEYHVKKQYSDIDDIDGVFQSIVVIRDKKTKKILYMGRNRAMLSASEFFARKVFEPYNVNINDNNRLTPVMDEDANGNKWSYKTPSYDQALNLVSTTVMNKTPFSDLNYKVCLFCIGRSGTSEGSSTKNATYRDKWISPDDDIIPFRYTTESNLSAEDKKTYYGKSKDTNGDYYKYYFKKINVDITSTDISVQKKYQNTDIEWGSSVYSEARSANESSTRQFPQVVVSCSMLVTETEGREYFTMSSGNSSARFNCLSLCFASPYFDTTGNIIDYYNIRCMTRINFTDKDLSDSSSYEISYSIYF